jgi:hypothetical protein
MLFGWLADNPLPVDLVGVPGETHATTLLVAPLPVSSGEDGAMVLGPGTLGWAYVGGGRGKSPRELYQDTTTDVFAFTLPVEAQGKSIERLFLHVDPLLEPAYGDPPAMWLKYPGGGPWEEVVQPKWGLNTVIDPQRFFDERGRIEIKVDMRTIDMPLSVDFSVTLVE